MKYVPEDIYYDLPEFVLYQNFPVYVREHEPAGYLDSLRALEPQIMVDFSQIKTEEEWIEAGKLVFQMPVNLGTAREIQFKDTSFVRQADNRITPEGIFPYSRYVVTPDGLKEGDLSCATCHSKVMDNGEVLLGGQGDFAFDRQFGFIVEQFGIQPGLKPPRSLDYTPWSDYDIQEGWTREDFIAALKAIPPGMMVRQGSGMTVPLTIPSLMGIRDIKYMDHTGLMKHENIGDLMRYAAFNQGLDMFTAYNGYVPMNGFDNQEQLREDKKWSHPFGYQRGRYSDAQLYALAKYLYSLESPKNPEVFPEEMLSRGEEIFAREGCVTCHTPPLFTNNKLIPASEHFPIPDEDKENLDIFNISVGTDSVLAFHTRRGTGYYKVPSLRGAWLRDVFFHSGNLASLEDVLDPARLEDDYVPTGFKPHNVETMAVKGHPFGMDLSAADREALLAYLKSL